MDFARTHPQPIIVARNRLMGSSIITMMLAVIFAFALPEASDHMDSVAGLIVFVCVLFAILFIMLVIWYAHVFWEERRKLQ